MTQKSQPGGEVPDVPEFVDADRQRMLYDVHTIWIEGVLQRDLSAGSIDLGFSLRSDAVSRHTDYTDYELPDSIHDIGRIFTDIRGGLLILGDAGGGKTISLLYLTKHLLEQAQHDATKPIPVVLNLSSWGKKSQKHLFTLSDWLIDELCRTYNVLRSVAARWVDDGQLALMLDGLDEIALSADFVPEKSASAVGHVLVDPRLSCVEAINAYRQSNPHVNIAVCSRLQAYELLDTGLDLNAALLLRPVTEEQIAVYLQGGGHEGTRDLLRYDPIARMMAQRPFLLTMMKTAYVNIPYRHLALQEAGEEARREHLLGEYIALQLKRNKNAQYSHDKTLRYSGWLASQMRRGAVSVFYIEDLPPNWAAHTIRYRLLVQLLVALLFGLFVWSGSGILFGLVEGLMAGLLFGLIVWLGFGPVTPSGANSRFRPNAGLRRRFMNGLISGLSGGLPIGLLGGLLTGLAVVVLSGLGDGLLAGLRGGVLIGLFGGLIIGLFAGWGSAIQHISLRLDLAFAGVIPYWRYDRFLDYCAGIGLLRKVGSGYIFRHRILLEYMADQYDSSGFMQ